MVLSPGNGTAAMAAGELAHSKPKSAGETRTTWNLAGMGILRESARLKVGLAVGGPRWDTGREGRLICCTVTEPLGQEQAKCMFLRAKKTPASCAAAQARRHHSHQGPNQAKLVLGFLALEAE